MSKTTSVLAAGENQGVLGAEILPQARFFEGAVHESARSVQNRAQRANLAGWAAAPAGRRCPDCAGAVRLKVVGVWERHRCRRCGWEQVYRVG